MIRIRPGFSLLTVAATLGLAFCSSSPETNVATSVEFEPNPAFLSSGVCVSTARIQEIEGEEVSLLSVTVVFFDSAETRAEFVFNADQLSSILDSQTLAPHGIATGSFSFDLASKGLKAPCDGTMVAVGAGNGAAILHFVGTLRCEETKPS